MEEKSWWAPFRSGFFLDSKHRKRMGNAIWLYGYLHLYADRRTGKLTRKVQTISDEIDVPTRTIESWFAVLRKGKYVKTQRLFQGLAIEILKWRPLKGGTPSEKNGGPSEGSTAGSAGVTRKIHVSNPQNPALTAENSGLLNNCKQEEKEHLTAENGGNKKSLLKESLKKEIVANKKQNEIRIEKPWDEQFEKVTQ